MPVGAGEGAPQALGECHDDGGQRHERRDQDAHGEDARHVIRVHFEVSAGHVLSPTLPSG